MYDWGGYRWGNWRTIKINYTKKFKFNNGFADDDDEGRSNLYLKIFNFWESQVKKGKIKFVIA